MKRNLVVLLAGVALLAMARPAAAQTNLVVNGDFNEAFTAWGSLVYNTLGLAPVVTGWTMTPAPVLGQSCASQASAFCYNAGVDYEDLPITGDNSTGQNSFVMDTNSAPGSLTQTLATVKGTQYKVTYWLELYDFCGACDAPDNSFSATWNGTAITGSTLTNSTAFGWKQYSFTVTGTGSDKIGFSGFSNDGELAYSLSTVSVAATSGTGQAPEVVSASAAATCSSYTMTINASGLTPGQSYTMDWTITPSVTSLASINGTVTFVAPSAGTYTGTVTNPIAAFAGSGTYTGWATLSGYNTVAVNFSPSTGFNCAGTPAPTCSGANSTLFTNLGSAGPNNFAVLSLGGSSGATLNLSSATVAGNVGAPNTVTLKEAATSSITNELMIGSSVSTAGLKGSHGTPVVNNTFLTQAVANAQSASSYFASLPSTTAVQSQFPANGTITSSLTVIGTPGLNVVNLSSFELLAVTGTLTLTGPAGTEFVINDSGSFTLVSGSIQVGGGVGPLDVVFNITKTSAIVTTAAATKVEGILLAPNTAINAINSSSYSGEIIAGYKKNFVLASSTNVTNSCQQ